MTKSLLLLFLLALTPQVFSAETAPQNTQPNFLVIVADDMGWSDISPFGGEIRTPTLLVEMPSIILMDLIIFVY